LRPYPSGILDPFPLTDLDPDAAAIQGQALIRFYERYLRMLSEEGGVELEIPRLLDDPSPLVFLAAITLQATNHEKNNSWKLSG